MGVTSCLSDIHRSHLKSKIKDKKKERGKSRQKTTGAYGAVYVEYSAQLNGTLLQALKLMSVSVLCLD